LPSPANYVNNGPSHRHVLKNENIDFIPGTGSGERHE
jgi:hypothetical protein